jgi:hypothetical protein
MANCQADMLAFKPYIFPQREGSPSSEDEVLLQQTTEFKVKVIVSFS